MIVLPYQLRNYRRRLTSLKTDFGAAVAHVCGVSTIVGRLYAEVCKHTYPGDGGRLVRLGLLSTRVVTDTGVAFIVDDWDNDAQNITNFNFHDSGTGSTAEAASQTDLITPAGPTTRATGTKSQPSANILRSVGTITYTGTLAIVEHGLFNQSTRGGSSVLWDRSVFSAINVVSSDSIQFTYEATLTAGG